MRSRLDKRAAPVQRSLRAVDIGRPHATQPGSEENLPSHHAVVVGMVHHFTRARAARSLDLSTKPRSRPIRRIRVMRFRSKARSCWSLCQKLCSRFRTWDWSFLISLSAMIGPAGKVDFSICCHMLESSGVKLIERGDQILSVCSSHGVLPMHVIQLDHAAAAVQHQPKGFHDWPSRQHRGFARQQVHLHIAILADAEGQTHSPSALQAGITAKVEGALAPHELDLGDVVVGLLELQHVAHKKGP